MEEKILVLLHKILKKLRHLLSMKKMMDITVDYSKLSTLFINAIKEQQQIIEDQQLNMVLKNNLKT